MTTSTLFFRKVIRIRALDSPNVQQGKRVLPGLLTLEEYNHRRATWDKIRACIGLDAEFYEGSEVLLYPPEWLNRAEQVALELDRGSRGGRRRQARAIGVDPAEGGDKTAMAAVDEYGLIELVSKQTPDTSVITSEALAFARKHGVAMEDVVFDRGGGGKEHADRLRAQGHDVRTVAFGESVALEPRRGMVMIEEKLDTREERYAYFNRRAEMYGMLRLLLDPDGGIQAGAGLIGGPNGWGLPAEYTELRRQLAPIPLKYDPEGRLKLPPKNKRTAEQKEVTLVDLIGCSPDEADAVVLAVYHLCKVPKEIVAGGIF